jgi:hypothetical protein
MSLCEVTTPRCHRYYLNGVRVSRAVVVALKGDHDLDTLHTVIDGDTTRHYSELRKRA